MIGYTNSATTDLSCQRLSALYPAVTLTTSELSDGDIEQRAEGGHHD